MDDIYLKRLYQSEYLYKTRIPIIRAKNGSSLLIGRSLSKNSNRICCASKFVSRDHAVIYFADSRFFIKDLGSLNPTFVNNKTVPRDGILPISPGDTIGIGINPASIQLVDRFNSEFFLFEIAKVKSESKVITISDEESSNEANHEFPNPENADDSASDVEKKVELKPYNMVVSMKSTSPSKGSCTANDEESPESSRSPYNFNSNGSDNSLKMAIKRAKNISEETIIEKDIETQNGNKRTANNDHERNGIKKLRLSNGNNEKLDERDMDVIEMEADKDPVAIEADLSHPSGQPLSNNISHDHHLVGVAKVPLKRVVYLDTENKLVFDPDMKYNIKNKCKKQIIFQLMQNTELKKYEIAKAASKPTAMEESVCSNSCPPILIKEHNDKTDITSPVAETRPLISVEAQAQPESSSSLNTTHAVQDSSSSIPSKSNLIDEGDIVHEPENFKEKRKREYIGVKNTSKNRGTIFINDMLHGCDATKKCSKYDYKLSNNARKDNGAALAKSKNELEAVSFKATEPSQKNENQTSVWVPYSANQQRTFGSSSKSQLSGYNQSTIPQAGTNMNTIVAEQNNLYLKILSWKPSWLDEQTNMSFKNPPLMEKEMGWDAKSENLSPCLLLYTSYDVYVKVFYPIMVLELWEKITRDYKGKSKVCKEPPVNHDMIITSRKYEHQCPLLKFRQHFSNFGSKIQKSNQVWCVLGCTFISHDNDSASKDLGILKIPTFKTNEEGQNEPIMDKDIFCIVLNTTCDKVNVKKANFSPQEKMLQAKTTLTEGFLIRQKLVCLLRPEYGIPGKAIGKIKTVTYIAPDIREMGALFMLRKSPLMRSIVMSESGKDSLDICTTLNPSSLVEYTKKLNDTQKSAVCWISEKVEKENPCLLLLHGPPGTGKTNTIIGIILQILIKNHRAGKMPKILVCTPSNCALDEIILRLFHNIQNLPKKLVDAMKIVRVGDSSSMNGQVRKASIDYLYKEQEMKSSKTQSFIVSISALTKQIEDRNKSIEEVANIGAKTTKDSLLRSKQDLVNQKKMLESELAKNLERNKADEREIKADIISNANVLFSTLSSCSNSLVIKALEKKENSISPHFSCCIIDEASQATEPATLTPLLLDVNKLILIGDPNQLGPTVISQTAKEKHYSRSLFNRLYESLANLSKTPVMMLKTQYRMHPEILKWPNEYFYQGQLEGYSPLSRKNLLATIKPYVFLNFESNETVTRSGSIDNEEEGKLVVAALNIIAKEKTGDVTVGVITPYSSQRRRLCENFIKKNVNLSKGIEINTVDSFQGKEKDIIVFSCVRTDSIGFLRNARRLNVALTRAKHCLIIIGHASNLMKDSAWKSLICDAKERKLLFDVYKTDDVSVEALMKQIDLYLVQRG